MRKNLSISSLIILPYLAGTVVLSHLTTGCTAIIQNQSLSTSKAQRMINKWSESGSIQVIGVREDSSNSAVATLQVSNFTFKTHDYFSNNRLREVNSSGPGKAKFSRYTDGVWTLTNIEFNRGDSDLQNAFDFDNLNIKND
ncbi:MAG: hypothetical protein ACM37W_04675 [Actinomycetota bacterium]